MITGRCFKVLGFLGALVLVGPALADDMTLTGVYNPNNVMGDVYDSPYIATINGVSGQMVICDDFTTDVSMGESWEADPVSLSDAGTGTKFTASDTGYSIQVEYAAAALLAEQLLANLNGPSAANSNVVGELSYAIWTIFDPGAITGYDNSLVGQTVIQGAITSYETAALTAAAAPGAVMPSGFTIYTPTPLSASQEYLVYTPEASTVASLIVDFLGLAGAVFFLRRRLKSRLLN